jgi:hypothetical protein
MVAAPGLTPEQLRSWDENGYLIIPDALDQDTVEGLLKEAHGLLEGEIFEIYFYRRRVSVRDEKRGTRALVVGGEALWGSMGNYHLHGSPRIPKELPELPELRSASTRRGANLL